MPETRLYHIASPQSANGCFENIWLAGDPALLKPLETVPPPMPIPPSETSTLTPEVVGEEACPARRKEEKAKAKRRGKGPHWGGRHFSGARVKKCLAACAGARQLVYPTCPLATYA